MKPFLKWAGNKYRIIDKIKEILPPGERLIEPFVGSGAVFLNTDYPAYLLGDTNAHLIQLLGEVKSSPTGWAVEYNYYFKPNTNTPEFYYGLRDSFNTSMYYMPWNIPSAFLYLNRHGFNGLCRYNSKGEFNVPFGKYTKPYFPEKEIQYFHTKSQNATFERSDFRQLMAFSNPGDVVYCDPPYTPISETSSFVSYSGSFGIDDHEALVRHAIMCRNRGVPVIISNHDLPITRELYKDATEIHSIEVSRSISCKGESRGKVPELLAVYK